MGPGDFKKYLAQIRSHYGAQMFWNTKTPKADGNAEAFMVRIKALGEPSTYVDPTRDTLAPGQYTIALSDGRALSVSGGTPTAGTASDNWELAATPDGYYQIRSVNANRCLAVYSEEKPNSETHVSTTPGHPVSAYACADMSQEFTPTFQGDYATHTPQKWVAETAGDGFRLRNAMTNQYLSVIDSGYLSRRPNGGEKTAEGTVAQLPYDVTVDSHSVFTLASQASSDLDVSIERVGDEAYTKTALSGMDRASLLIIGDENWGETVIKVSVTNKCPTDATKIHLTPAVSNSWKLANGPKASGRAKDVQIYLAGSADGLKGQGDNKGNPSAQGNPVLATSLANVPGTVDIPVAGNGSYLRFRGTSAQADVAKDLTDVMSVAELGVCIGRSN